MKQRQNKIYEKTTSSKLHCARRSSTPGGFSFPLELTERRDNVALAIFVEQFPPGLFASPGFPGYLGKRYPLGNEHAQLADQAVEVATFVLNSASPIADDRAMSGNNALGGNAQQFLGVSEKAANAAVKDRHMRHEKQIACKQGRSCAIEHRQIVVGMRRLPRLQNQLTPAEIDLHFVIDEQRGWNNPYFVNKRVAELDSERLEVKF